MKFLILSLAVVALSATAIETSVTTVEKKKSGFIAPTLSLDHYATTQEEDYEFSTMVVSAGYRLNDAHSFSVAQSLTKWYSIRYGTDEFDFGNTKIGYSYKTPLSFLGTSISAGGSVTLPLSRNAIHHDKLSHITATVSVSRRFFDGKVSVSYTPNVFYYLNEFKQSAGGHPLPEWGYGNSLSLTYSPIDRFTLAASASASTIHIYKTMYRLEDIPADGRYSFGLNGSFAVIPKRFNLKLGYSQGNSLITQGRMEFYLFDERSTTLSAGLDYTF